MAKLPMICLLSHDGRPEIQVTEFIQQVMFSNPPGWSGVRYRSYCGNSMLPHVRNSAVSDFLSMTECTDLIFVDCDNITEPGGLEKLTTYDVDVVGAPCRGKTDEEIKWPVRWLTDRPIRREPNGLIEVETVGTGILRISRKCLEAMRDAIKFDWYHDRFAIDGRSWPIFQYRVEDHSWLGEDVKFCLDWRKLGGKIYIDPSIVTHHVGRKAYSGSVGQWLKINPPTLSITPAPVSVKNDLSELT